MSISETIKKRAERYRKMQADFHDVVQSAADDCKRVAMEHTPHKGDAGTGLTTGDLASHWSTRVKWHNDKEFTVYLANTMQYASFVNDGHRMVRHFVPWLIIDNSGHLRKMNKEPGEPLTGIFVGTKTKYVEPVPMIKPAVDEFFKRYKIGKQKLKQKYGV